MSSDVRKPDSTPYGRTLKQYSIDEKLAIINHAKSHGNRAAGREFNVAESSIREWRKNELKLINSKTPSMPGMMNNHNNNNNHKSQMQNATMPVLNPEMIRFQLAQFAQMAFLKSMDLNNSPPFPIISPLYQKPPEPGTPTQPCSSDSTTSSVGTPSSVSSASTPPPAPSPVPPAGSGRRKLRVPQKIVAQEAQEVQDPDSE